MRLGVLLEQCLAPVPGGTGRYSREVAAALAATAAPGDVVQGWVAWHRDLTGARVTGVQGPRRLPLARRPLLAAWQRGAGPKVSADVVLAPTPLAPPWRGTGLVVVVHDAVPWTHPETLTRRGVAWHLRAVRRAAEHADLVVVPTNAVAEQLRNRLSVPRLLVVGEGVSDALAMPADADTRAERLALPPSFLLTVATLEPRKGLAALVRALPEATDLPLLCAGQPGWGGEDLGSVAAAAGLPPGRVRTLGRVEDADLAVLLRRATAVVVPSRAEGFGLPLLEAMSVGTPVLSTDDPALVEVAGGAALCVPHDRLARGLRELLGDEELRARLRRSGPVRASAYTWQGAARRLWAAFHEVQAGLGGR